jgi:hypothetical protein
MVPPPRRIELDLLARWVLANGIVGVAGTVVSGRIRFSVDLVATAAAVGIMEAHALRWPFLLVASWTLASVTGAIIGGVLGGDVSAAVGGRLGFATGLTAAGATVGMAQGLVLQGRIARFEWWIAANAAADVLGGIMGHETFELLGGIFGAVAGRVVGGTVIGAITGFTLTRLRQDLVGKG